MALYTVQNSAPEAKGWLWRQLGVGGSAWCKLWAVLRSSTLEFFTNSQESPATRHSVVYIDFRYDIEEVEDTDRKAGQPGRRCHTGFLVKATGVGELLRRGTAEEQTDCDCAGVQTVLLAACNIAEHAAWRKKLQSCANAAHAAALAARRHEAAPLLMASESCFDAGVPAPNALVVARLCTAGREQGVQLLRLVRSARLAFQSGALPASFTVETAGAGRAMQTLLAHLQAMQAAVASHSDVGEDAAALAAARAWVARASAWVAASQDRLGVLVVNGCLPSQWGAYARAAADKLQGIEHVRSALLRSAGDFGWGGPVAMQSGRAAEEARALRAAAAAWGIGPGGRARCYTARGSAMPYKAWWANKVLELRAAGGHLLRQRWAGL